MEKWRPIEAKLAQGHRACLSEADSRLERSVPNPSSELSLSEDPTSKVIDERQVLPSPGDASASKCNGAPCGLGAGLNLTEQVATAYRPPS